MREAAVGADEFGEMGQEGDDVVLGDALDLIDAVDIELGRAALFPDGLCRILGYDAEGGERVGRMRLDLEPDAELGFLAPDGCHLGAGVARDHGSAFSLRGWRAV